MRLTYDIVNQVKREVQMWPSQMVVFRDILDLTGNCLAERYIVTDIVM